METSTTRVTKKRKALAIAAGFAAIGIGASATLAAWTDSEWVFGGDGTGGPGIGTSTFSVQQSTDGGTTFTDEAENPGGEIVFGVDALDLTPGDTVYAAVALRSAPGSLAGEVTLQSADEAAGIVAGDPDGLLFDALEVAVVTDDAAIDCDADAFDAAPGLDLIADGPLAVTGGGAAQALDADAGSVQYYCFALTLPDTLTTGGATSLDDYMGLTVAPAWEFAAISS